MRSAVRNWRVHLGIGVAIVLSALLITYAVIVNSAAYEVAKRFVEASDSVRAVTGAIKSERLGVRYLRFNPFRELRRDAILNACDRRTR